jgi:predicted AlkP superfamily pyrophosphatase or phosphodiesterase
MARVSAGAELSKPAATALVGALLGAIALLWMGCAMPTLEAQRVATSRESEEALRAAGPPRRVVIITVAGLESADFLNAWGYVASDGDAVRMPRLAILAREGAVGVDTFPPAPGATYSSHATLVTGRLPVHHGVIADTALDDDGKRALPFWDNRLLQGGALWDAAIGRGVLALGWPSTTGARIELIVPDARPVKIEQGWIDLMGEISSPTLFRQLEAIHEQAMDELEDSEPARNPTTWPDSAELDAAFAELACSVARSERDPGLWFIRFAQTADALHVSGYGSVEVDTALNQVDQEIGQILDCLAEAEELAETAVFVMGDVAYRPVHTRVDPNVALVKAGLVGRDPRSTGGFHSWLALSRSNGRSAYVYARDAANAVDAREVLEEAAVRTGAFRVVSAEELAASGGDRQAWFGLVAEPGFVLGNGMMKPEVRPAELRGSEGGFPFLDPQANAVGFVAWGRGIRPQVRVPRVEMVDIAPTIAMLLGLRLESEPDGEPLIGILRAAVPPPPPGPKRLGIDTNRDAQELLREMGGGRR